METPSRPKINKKRSTTPYNRNNNSNNRRSSTGCFAPFKSPCSSKSTKRNEETPTTPHNPLTTTQTTRTTTKDDLSDKVKLAQEVVSLHQKCDEIDKEIQLLQEEYDEDELPMYVDRLHKYNEIKDVAQSVIGRIAEKEGTTTRNLYERFDLDLDD